MITLFDIPSNIPEKTWSLHTWRTRLSLNYKGLPYKTEWVEYPDIAAVLQKHNIGPTDTKQDGTPYYSVPAIIDVDDDTGETKAALAESFKIAEYLDQAYPDTPKILPVHPTQLKELRAFSKGFLLTMLPLLTIIFKATMPQLNEASRGYFSRARAMDMYAMYQTKTLEEIPLSAEQKAEFWAGVKQCFDHLEGKLAVKGEEGPWYLRNEISFGDFVIGGFLLWVKTIFGVDSPEWTDVTVWNGGRWTRFLERLSPYQAVDV